MLTQLATPHLLLNIFLEGEKGEHQVEKVFGGPPCTVPEITDQQVECVASLQQHCNNVYEDYCVTLPVGEECKKEVQKDCKNTYTTECITEWVKVCEEEDYIEYQADCQEKLSQECQAVSSGLECKDIPTTICSQKPVKKQRSKCQQNPKQQCKSTPESNCKDIPKTVCRPTAKLHCTKLLKREDCREIPSLNCKPTIIQSVDVPCGGGKFKKF